MLSKTLDQDDKGDKMFRNISALMDRNAFLLFRGTWTGAVKQTVGSFHIT